MAKRYNLRNADSLEKVLRESEAAKESAIDGVSDEDDNLEMKNRLELEEDADNETFKPLEQIESVYSDSEGEVPEKKQKRGRSITCAVGCSNRGRKPSSIVRSKHGHRACATTPRGGSQKRQKSPDDTSRKKPGRCGLCPRSRDRKTRVYCTRCQRPTCEEHRIIYCSDCDAFQEIKS